MARDVEFDVTANDKTEPALTKTERNFKRSQEQMTRDAEREQKKRDALVKKTQVEQERAAKRAERDREKEHAEVRETLGFITAAAQDISPKLAASLAKTFSGAAEAGGPLLLAGIAGAVTAGLPLIGATISAGIIGGAGLGGVIGGLVLASKDARVRAAAKEVGDSLQKRLELAGGSFVQPAIDGIHTIEKALDGINVEQILGDSAKFVQPLAEGIARAVTSIGDGIEDLVRNAGPVIDSIADGIAGIGDALGDGLKALADNGPEAASALNVVFFTIESSLAGTLASINALTELYGVIEKIGGVGVLGVLSNDMDNVSESGRRVGEGTFGAAQGIQKVTAAATSGASGLRSLQEQLDAATSAARTLFGASTSVGEAIDRVTAAAKENGRTLDSGTKKGRANREAVANLAETLLRQSDAYREVHGAGAAADGIAARNRATFIRLATSLTGSASKARALADRLLGIPAKRDTKVNANTHDAEARLKALKAKLDAIRGKTVTVTVAVNAGALNKARLGKSGPQINAGADDYWFAADRDGATSRTGGPAPVSVNNQVDVAVMLDGSVIDARIDTKVRASEKRQIRRQQGGPG